MSDGVAASGSISGVSAVSGSSAALGTVVWACACRVRPTAVKPLPITTAVTPATSV